MVKIQVPTFLKWAGGKQQLLPQLSIHFPTIINNYVEPFLGGGSTFFYVLKYKEPATARAYDHNAELINVYNQVRENVNELMKELTNLQKEHNSTIDKKKYYYDRRIEFNTFKRKKLKMAALFIYLNKTCYNGLYRVNSRGEFNVPFNGEVSVRLFDVQEILEASKLLNRKGTTIEHEDFKGIKINENDVVYFDPPYWSEPNDKGFTNYVDNGFNAENQRILARIFHDLASQGNTVLLSNSSTSFIDELYSKSGYDRYKIRARRMINCDGEGRNEINESLIVANTKRIQKYL